MPGYAQATNYAAAATAQRDRVGGVASQDLPATADGGHGAHHPAALAAMHAADVKQERRTNEP